MRALRFFVAGVLLGGLGMPVFARVCVTFHDGAPVKRTEIQLSDIAAIVSDNDSLVSELAQIKIGKAAIAGYNRRFDTDRINLTYLSPYRNRGFEIVVRGPKDVSIATASRVLTEVSITEILRKQIYEKAPFSKDKIQISFTSVPEKVIVPDTDCQLSLTPKEDCDWRGVENMNVIVRNGDKEIRRFPVSVRFRVFETVCVTDGKIKRNTTITASDIRSELREITDITERVFSKPSDLIG
jgi:hypothetical protein